MRFDGVMAPAATDLLYHTDSLLLAFEAQVVGHGAWENRPSVILDRTAFYPESGGQMADRGSLAGASVKDVQIDAANVVHHVLEGELPALGARVRGTIEPARRRVHMALHTGQHILSRAFVEVAGADTISSRLGETECTIDVTVAEVSEQKLARIEDLANEIVDADLIVQSFFPDEEYLSRLVLRRIPKVSENVRIVAVGDFDLTPCGGTHCQRSAQVGLLKVTGIERYKRGTRVRFSAGARARQELGAQANLLKLLSREFSCNAHELLTAVGKLRRELGEARSELSALRLEQAERVAERALAEAEQSGGERVVLVLPGAKLELLRAIASRITGLPGRVAFLAAPSADGCSVLVARSEQSSFDCGAFLKRAAQQTGGRGGGRADRAEGRLPADTDWPGLVAASP